MDILKVFIGGVVVVALVSAVGMHASGLANVTSKAGTAGSGLLHTAETGNS